MTPDLDTIRDQPMTPLERKNLREAIENPMSFLPVDWEIAVKRGRDLSQPKEPRR